MNGTVDEVRVYNQALDFSNVAADGAVFVPPLLSGTPGGNLATAYSFNTAAVFGHDDSENGNDLAASGNASYTSAGYNSSGAATFDGSTGTYLQTPAVLNLNNDGLTVEAWVNMTSVSGLQGVVAESETTTYNGYGFGLYVSGGHIGCYFNDGNFTNTSTGTITSGSWHFLALTYNPGASPNVALYIDDTSAPAQTWTWANSPTLIADSYLYVGSDAYGHLMNGTVDEVRVYSTALTATQINTDGLTPVLTQITGGASSPASGDTELRSAAFANDLKLSSIGPVFGLPFSMALGGASEVSQDVTRQLPIAVPILTTVVRKAEFTRPEAAENLAWMARFGGETARSGRNEALDEEAWIVLAFER